MKKYITLLFLFLTTVFISCMDDEFEEAESLEAIIKDIVDRKNILLTRDKECLVCNFDETTPEVIYCDNGVNEDGENVILQISQGTVVEIVGITLLDQIEKVSKSAVCDFYTEQ